MSGDWCTSNNKVNSSSFLADAVKLKLQQECLEKASFAAIKNIKCSDRDLAQEIISMYKDKESERYEERERLNNVVFSTLNSLKQLKNEIKNEDRLRKLDIDLYRKSLVDLQKRIRTINEESEESLQKLSEDELLLTEEMKCLENKINDWNQPIAPSILKPAVRSVSKSYISNTDNSRQKFLEDHGGHTGGWSDEDHMLFLRLRNKSKRKLTFLSLLSQHLPEWKVSKSNNVKDETEVKIIQQRKTKPLEDPEKKKQLILEWKQTLQLKKELENQEEWDRKQKELEQIQKKREKQASSRLEKRCNLNWNK
ncbi:hypothetical protein C0J52_15212 [Blattella germanica]|nr:hypothetical protein C0J52_15212 [Blattella germanica]